MDVNPCSHGAVLIGMGLLQKIKEVALFLELLENFKKGLLIFKF